MSEIKNVLLRAPSNELDPVVHSLIEKWDEQPTSLQVLEVLDKVIHGSLASSFTVMVLQTLYGKALANENTTHDEVVKLAVWRDQL